MRILNAIKNGSTIQMQTFQISWSHVAIHTWALWAYIGSNWLVQTKASQWRFLHTNLEYGLKVEYTNKLNEDILFVKVGIEIGAYLSI